MLTAATVSCSSSRNAGLEATELRRKVRTASSVFRLSSSVSSLSSSDKGFTCWVMVVTLVFSGAGSACSGVNRSMGSSLSRTLSIRESTVSAASSASSMAFPETQETRQRSSSLVSSTSGSFTRCSTAGMIISSMLSVFQIRAARV